MNITAPHSSRVIYVGDADWPGTGAGAAPAVRVGNYLQALGELADRPIDAVVGSIEPMLGEEAATARALRELAGSDARLLLVVDPAHEPAAMRAVRLGFDDYFVTPLRRGELADALADIVAHRDELPVQTPAPRAELPRQSPQPAPSSSVDHDAEAGVLIDQLLAERGSLCDTIVKLLRRRVGNTLLWAAEPDLDAHACVPIMRGEQSLGYLVSDDHSDRELIAHADWAAKWLAVERRIIELKRLAMRDELTGAWNRRYFRQFLESILRRAAEQHFRVTLMLFDIDDFKRYNDEYGHAAGDEILHEAARLMQTVVRRHDVVARVGGDEFAVIFWDADAPRKIDSQHPHSVRRAAARFQQAICQHKFPKLGDLARGTLTISGGLASYPWDGQTGEALVQIADDMMLKSKRQGKNAITLGPGAVRVCGLPGDEPAPPTD